MRFLFRLKTPAWAGALLAVALLSSCGNLAGPSAQNSPPKTVALDPLMAGMALSRTALRSTVTATIKQPFTTIRQGLAVALLRPREIVASNLTDKIVQHPSIAETPGTAAFEQLLDDNRFPKPHLGTLKWLVDGKGFFGEMDRQIAAAQKSIRAQFYIFDNDDIAVRYADKFRERSHEIDVDILYDDFGTATAHLSGPKTQPPADFEPPSDMEAYLEKDSKVDVRMTLNPWLVADHTKLVVFDDTTAILGGMNLGREYYNEWHDLMVRVEGPVVAQLASVLSKSWRNSGRFGNLAFLAPAQKFSEPAPIPSAIPIRILRTDAGYGRHEILDASVLAIRGAKRRILIENPYFANDEVVTAVSAAARRGVDVKVILPAEGDSAIMDAGNLATARALIEAGAKVYRYPRMTHMKVMVCDDWATMGSANFDTLSMRINRELNVAFADVKEVQELVATIFRPDIAVSRRITLGETKDVKVGFAEAIADQL